MRLGNQSAGWGQKARLRRVSWYAFLAAGMLSFSGSLLAGTAVAEDARNEIRLAQGFMDENDPFRALVSRRGPSTVKLTSREPQLFSTSEGDAKFTFQVLGRSARIRFHCGENEKSLECDLLRGDPGEEIILLSATRSPRGDVIYKDSDGHAVLRVTATGGATLYVGRDQRDLYENELGGHIAVAGGEAVIPEPGFATSLDLGFLTTSQVNDRIQAASDNLYVKHNVFISFFTSDYARNSQAVLADAVLMSAKAIDMIAADELGARVIRERLETVELIAGAEAGLSLNDNRLTVVYNAKDGIAGRPSSAEIAKFLESEL